jgi:hypothetical protein
MAAFKKNARFAFEGFPTKQGKYRGTLVLVPGSNSDGRKLLENPKFRELAQANNLLMVGCYFWDDVLSSIELYCDMREGAGEALIQAVESYTKLSRFDAKKFPKFLMWGFSAGGQFNWEFTNWCPEVVDAYVVNKGGVYYTALLSKKARQVPGVIFSGMLDEKFRRNILEALYTLNSTFGAPIRMIDEDTHHEMGHSVHFSIEFFDEILNPKGEM